MENLQFGLLLGVIIGILLGILLGFAITAMNYDNSITTLGKEMCNEHDLEYGYFMFIENSIQVACKKPIQKIEDGYLILVDNK